MTKLNYGRLVVGLTFALLCIWVSYLIVEKYPKEDIDNINEIIHNKNYQIGDFSRFDLNQSYYKIMKEAEKRRLVAERQAMLDKLKAERELELKRQKLEEERKRKVQAKKDQEKKVVVSRGQADSSEWYLYEVTFYTAGYESTQKRKGEAGYGVTASGSYVQEGRTAACPKSLDFGTKVYIDGFGYRICEDRGNAITENHLDVYVDSLDKARQLGRQKLKVKIIK
ncbi:3D domain-containing protein [Ureibacillus chungkukjangi]|uniref:3D domain-containing protein n=1 Tax=Ureibacillus chungkukjangi TaxID=1202712 RepID=UPI002040EE7C|nr:3D domain-containing protein [Ureibacillus chungkukjangi]MCM3387192.1 3D domain-containing protein [Ureibacillus chungkukjangi]